MPKVTSYQFFISQRRFFLWSRIKKDLSATWPITARLPVEALFETLFPSAADHEVSVLADKETIFCEDYDYIDGRRSVELARVKSDTKHAPEILFRITVTDTVGNISDAEAILRHESLLIEHSRLWITLGTTNATTAAVVPRNTTWMYLAAAMILSVAAIVIT